VLWAVVGYSLAFGEGNPFVGGMQYFMLNGVGTAPSAYAATIPHLTFMIYQLMFAIITPALISGAFAERMKFSGMILFTILWALIVYFPMAHMVWGAGGLLGVAGAIPCLDFAGGTVVHITSGFSALLWVGWFGFNAGSALGAGGLASSAFVATHFGAAAAACGWMLAEWMKHGKPSMLGGISGCVAGLVAITPAAGFVTPGSALIIGLAGGIFCFLMATTVKSMFGYDDSLDAFGVHGAGGTIGAILTGVFATKEVNDLFAGKPMGMLEGNGGQVVNQLIGCGIAIALGVVGTFVILKVVDMITGVRCTADEEIEGLDLSMHGEEGYSLEA